MQDIVLIGDGSHKGCRYENDGTHKGCRYRNDSGTHKGCRYRWRDRRLCRCARHRVIALAEDGGSNADFGGAFCYGPLEVAAHAHGQAG